MPRAESVPAYKNRILASLPKQEISRLAPYLSSTTLEVGKTLLGPGEKNGHAYFMESGLASITVTMEDAKSVETGLTGNEGIVGIPGLLGTESMPGRTFIQIAGSGFCIAADRLRHEYERPGILRRRLNRFFQAQFVQTAQTAACNRLHEIAQRLARWLLMCHDRMQSDSFQITHEFLGLMLGAPRSTVTLAAGMLHKAGLIDYSRGQIHVRDRKGLEEASCECYATIRNEYDRLGVLSLRPS